MGWLDIISNASKKGVKYFTHPLYHKLKETMLDHSLLSEVEV